MAALSRFESVTMYDVMADPYVSPNVGEDNYLILVSFCPLLCHICTLVYIDSNIRHKARL
jgi:hypothetical protein